MPITAALILIFWIIFLGVWFVTSFSQKANTRRGNPLVGVVIRVAIAFAVVYVMRSRTFTRLSTASYNNIPHPILHVAGVVLCATGIALAMWARAVMGKNWGMPMTEKSDPELVTSGPYNYIRHPIYTGILLAITGSALVAGVQWLVVSICAFAYFIYSARREEHIMERLFPDTYPEYRERTRMLVPFIL